MKRLIITLALLAALITGSWVLVHHAYAAAPEPTKEQLVTQITALDKDYQLKQAQAKLLDYEMRDIAEAYKAAKAKLDAIVKAEKDAKDKAKK